MENTKKDFKKNTYKANCIPKKHFLSYYIRKYQHFVNKKKNIKKQ